MKILAIEDEKGKLTISKSKTKSVQDIEPADIEAAAMLLMESDETIEEALFDKDEDKIKNPAAKIIYEQLYKAFSELLESKESILNEINEVFNKAEEKYKMQKC